MIALKVTSSCLKRNTSYQGNGTHGAYGQKANRFSAYSEDFQLLNTIKMHRIFIFFLFYNNFQILIFEGSCILASYFSSVL